MEALKRLLDGDDALPPLLPGENERKSKLCTLLSRVGRLMNIKLLTLQTRRQNTLQLLYLHFLQSNNKCARL
jgi:hypothetical protein